jgi:hypothetical protein
VGITQIFNQFANSLVDTIPGVYQPVADLEEEIASNSANVVMVSAVLLVFLVILAALLKDRLPRLKTPLFIMIAFTMAASTLYISAATVYINVKSDSGGPVHWHADIEVWACGNELEIRNPTGFLSNKIGTATLHEHDDHRIHLEGVVVDDEVDASLGKFFHVIDGALTANDLVLPVETDQVFEDEVDGDGPSNPAPELVEPYLVQTDNGTYAKFSSGQTCGDQTAYVQTFVYKYNEANDTYMQEKLVDPVTYDITGNPNVPPGDCIIVEFDALKDQTDKLCEQYGFRDVDRCEEFGVTPEERAICTMEQVNYPSLDPNMEQLDPVTPQEQEQLEQSEGAGAAGTQLEGTGDFNDTPGIDPVILPDTESEAN